MTRPLEQEPRPDVDLDRVFGWVALVIAGLFVVLALAYVDPTYGAFAAMWTLVGVAEHGRADDTRRDRAAGGPQ